MNHERLSMMKPTAVVMHPGPMNRGVEIDDVTADGERSLILRQVANGVPVRMAVIAEALEGGA
jgi:aspartate carbamoyltransferase catalytic subunit